MTEIKLIAFDYDRVLTNENLKFDDRLIPHLEDIRNNGIISGIITGRRWNYIEQMKSFFDFIVYENGFFLYYDKHIKLFDKIQENTAKNVKKILATHNVDCIFGELLISCTLDKMNYVMEIKDSIGDIDIVTNIDRFLILPKGINKGSALKYVLNMFNIKEDNAAVVGDGENDVLMFKNAGFPACIGNSIEELKKLSRFCANKKFSNGTMEILSYLKNMDYKYNENI